jgi:hypothetical protein
MPKRVLAVARGDAKAGRLCKSCNAGSARFGMNPEGRGPMRCIPLLQLLTVAPLRRVAAPRSATHSAPSHSRIN